MAGAPLGNKNAAKPRVWHQAIMRALETRDKSRVDGKRELDALAEKLIELVAAGDLAAIKEFGDRLDGKPAQAIIGGDENDPPVKLQTIEIRAVDANRPAPQGS